MRSASQALALNSLELIKQDIPVPGPISLHIHILGRVPSNQLDPPTRRVQIIMSQPIGFLKRQWMLLLMLCRTTGSIGDITAVVTRIQTVSHMADDRLELEHVLNLWVGVVHIVHLGVLARQRGPAPLVVEVVFSSAMLLLLCGRVLGWWGDGSPGGLCCLEERHGVLAARWDLGVDADRG